MSLKLYIVTIIAGVILLFLYVSSGSKQINKHLKIIDDFSQTGEIQDNTFDIKGIWTFRILIYSEKTNYNEHGTSVIIGDTTYKAIIKGDDTERCSVEYFTIGGFYGIQSTNSPYRTSLSFMPKPTTIKCHSNAQSLMTDIRVFNDSSCRTTHFSQDQFKVICDGNLYFSGIKGLYILSAERM